MHIFILHCCTSLKETSVNLGHQSPQTDSWESNFLFSGIIYCRKIKCVEKRSMRIDRLEWLRLDIIGRLSVVQVRSKRLIRFHYIIPY